jgi:hypothetical protein
VVRTNCDLIGGAVCVAGVIYAVLNVTLNTLVVLATILIIHYSFPPLLGILKLLLPEVWRIIQKFKF